MRGFLYPLCQNRSLGVLFRGHFGQRYMPDCLIGLGSNVGNRPENIRAAIAALDVERQITVARQSRYFETDSIGGPPDQPGFLNACIRLTTVLSPLALFEVLQAIERNIGQRKTVRWGPRSLDLDLLLYDEQVVVEGGGTDILDSTRLIVPHRRMSFRRFVLEPAAEVAPGMCHPTIGLTVGELLEHLNRTLPYVAMAVPLSVGYTPLAGEVSRRTGCHLITMQKKIRQTSRQRIGRHDSKHRSEQQVSLLESCTAVLCPEQLPNAPVISDFWFDTLLVNAQRTLDSSQLTEYEILWSEGRRQVVTPRLVVMISSAPSDALDTALTKQAHGQGPLLVLDGTDFQQQCNEVEAALRACL